MASAGLGFSSTIFYISSTSYNILSFTIFYLGFTIALMYAEVVVPSYKGPNVDNFTYEIPAGLQVKVGQLVMVPFGKVRVVGLVWGVRERLLPPDQIGARNDKFEVKAVDSLIFERPFLLPYQLKLIEWMARYYLSTTGNCVGAMLPELPRSLDRADSRGSFGPVSLATRGGQESTLSQTLVLVPTINRLPQVMALFPKAKDHVVYHGQLKPFEKLSAWQKMISGDADFIFGSRQAVFSPCPNLKKIIIFSEHEGAYKDERSPFFDTLTVAEKIRGLTGCELQIIDSSPRITTFYNFKNATKFPRTKSAPRVKIVSMVEEKAGGNKSPVSSELEMLVENTISGGGKVLLFLNKKKESGTLFCRACKHQESLKKEPEACPNCKSSDIWFGSLNIKSLDKEVAKIFPKAKIEQVTEKSFGLNDANISLATSAVFYKLMMHKYELVAAVSLDSLINTPEFNSGEKLYSLITMLKRITKDCLVLQTSDPQNPAVVQASASDYSSFYDREITERKQLSYPPHGFLVKLVFKGKDSNKILEKAEKLCTLLESSFAGVENPPEVLGPFEPFYQKRLATYHVILKTKMKDYSLQTREQAVDNLRPLLLKTGHLSLIDQIIVEPEGVN